MKARRARDLLVLAVAVVSLAAAGCSADKAGTPGNESQGGELVLPATSNPIVNDATAEGLKITAAVENNVDPVTKKNLSDRLQIEIENTSEVVLRDLEIFYEMTDSTTKQTEGYYQQLTGFQIPPGEHGTVYFDGESGYGHYPENAFSLYRTSKNEVVFSIQVSAPGYKLATTEAAKAPGGEEGAE